MRITDSMAYRTFLTNLQDIRGRLFKHNLELSTGKSLNRPSDDPQASARVLRIRDQASRIHQYSRNIERARVTLSSSDGALATVVEFATDVSEKLTRGLNEILSQVDLDALATEIDEILASVLHVAGTSVDGKRLFSGSNLFTDPLALVGSTYVYQGDGVAQIVEIADNRLIQTNVIGSDVFTEPSSDLVNTIKQAAEALRIADTTTAAALLSKLNTGIAAVDSARIQVGVTLRQLDSTHEELNQQLLFLTQEISTLEDADLAQTISALNLDETALSAALEAGSRLPRLSLFDFFG